MWISPICAHCQEGAVERWWVNISVLWMHRQASKMVWILDTVQLVHGTLGTVIRGSSEQNHLWWMCPRRSTPIKRSSGIPYLFLVYYWNLKNTRRQGSYLFKSINSWLCPGMQLPLLRAMSALCPQSAPVDSFRGMQWLINSIVFFQFPWLSDWYIREKISALICVLYSCIGMQ